MLKEYEKVSQHKDGFRRYFCDDFFDLFVWYDNEGNDVVGFQLCYDKKRNEHSFIWESRKGFLHSGLDTGENNPGKAKQSPILIPDGYFDNIGIARMFEENSTYIDIDISEIVHQKLLGYDKTS